MSRVAKAPITIPAGVEVKLDGRDLSVKGAKGEMALRLHEWVEMAQEDGALRVSSKVEKQEGVALAGTTRSLVNSMVIGVHQGFERRLMISGVGYRAQAQGQTLNLTLGFSHPVRFEVPEGVTVETPSNTEVVVRGIDKQRVGEVAAKIRRFRPPEPYKGKGVRYADERVVLKEAKKK